MFRAIEKGAESPAFFVVRFKGCVCDSVLQAGMYICKNLHYSCCWQGKSSVAFHFFLHSFILIR